MEFTGERYVPNSIADTEQNTGFEHWQRYIAVKNLLKDKRVLDIASGEGYGAHLLSETAKYVIGMDISIEAIDYARKTYVKENLDYRYGSVENIEIENNSLDAIVSFETIEHVDYEVQRKFLEEVKRILKQDGLFIVSCPNKAIASDLAFQLWNYKNEFHKKEYYVGEFKQFLLDYFDSVQILYQRTEEGIFLNEINVKKLHVIKDEDKKYTNVQNIIAVCSNKKTDVDSMNTVVLDIRECYIEKQKQLSFYLKEISRLNNEIKVLYNNNTDLHKGNLNDKETIEILSKESLKNKEAIETLNLVNEKQDIELRQLKSDIANLLIENKNINSERAALIQKNYLLEEKVDELLFIKNSTLWKLTAPIRKILDIIKSIYPNN